LEQFTTEGGQTVTAFAFTGGREDIWHRLGQSISGRSMTGEEAMRESHMDRLIRIVPIEVPEGAEWAIPNQYQIVLEGTMFATEDDIVVVPDKVVGIHGEGGADAHQHFTIRDRFELAEEAIHASNGEAVWSTAGSLREGTQGFATMLAPDIVIDPQGINDIIRQYLTLTWSFDGTRATELSASEIRVVCANTLACHDNMKQGVIKVKHTSHTAQERFKYAAAQWSMAQDRAKALKLQAERMLQVRDSKLVLRKLVERFDPARETASKREQSLRKTRVDTLERLSYASTNTSVGDNGWAAWNTYVEYLDWEAPVKCSKGESEGDRRLGNQFDNTHESAKVAAAEFVMSLAN
jgi:phage/plasmid-like protein (TIGR03299 family)